MCEPYLPKASSQMISAKEANPNLTSYFFHHLLNQEETTQPQENPRQPTKEKPFNSENPNRSKKFRTYQCSYLNCCKAYKSKENLILHVINIHKKQKPYKCTHCDKKFSHRNGRIYHERKNHTIILPYGCHYNGCQQSFPCKSALVAHVKCAHLHIKRIKK